MMVFGLSSNSVLSPCLFIHATSFCLCFVGAVSGIGDIAMSKTILIFKQSIRRITDYFMINYCCIVLLRRDAKPTTKRDPVLSGISIEMLCRVRLNRDRKGKRVNSVKM